MTLPQTAAVLMHAACAGGYAILAVLILLAGRLSRTGGLLALACAAMMGWAATAAIQGAVPSTQTAALTELASRAAWFGFLLHLLRRGSAESWQIGRVLGGIALLILLLMVADFGALRTVAPEGPATADAMVLTGRLLFAVCSLLLLENVYYNTGPDGRWHLNLMCVALGGLFLYDGLLYADAMLFRRVSETLFVSRPVADLMVMPLLALGAARNRRWKIDLHVSRQVAFHSASLVMSGLFLLALAATAALFRDEVSGGWGSVAQVTVMFGGATLVAVLLTSGTARSWLRGTLVRHFFSSRYDYRQEWMRCNAILSGSDARAGAEPGAVAPMQTRMIRAIAELVDSPAGALFVREPDAAALVWAGSWNMPAAAAALDAADGIARAVTAGGRAVDLSRDAALLAAPALAGLPKPWLAVPMRHNAELVGIVVVSRPRSSAFALDTEVFELLAVVGEAVGSRIAEQIAMRRLSESRQFADYNKRFAFVVHDIKNVAGQLSMVLANAEVHHGNPEFQADVLATVRASAERIGSMLRKIAEREPGAQAAAAPKPGLIKAGPPPLIEPGERIGELLAARRSAAPAPVVTLAARRQAVAMDEDAFGAVITHLLDNAEQANARAGRGDRPVRITLEGDGAALAIVIADDGTGMTPEFVRDQLFAPFQTTRRDGHGIGAYQARALLREAGGDLVVRSRAGEGTEMRIVLPALALPASSALDAPAAADHAADAAMLPAMGV